MSSRRTLRGQTAEASRRRNDEAPEHDNDSESQLTREQEGLCEGRPTPQEDDEFNLLGGQPQVEELNSEDDVEIGNPEFSNDQGLAHSQRIVGSATGATSGMRHDNATRLGNSVRGGN